MTAAEKYVMDCRKWHDRHARRRRRTERTGLYPVPGCRIFIG